MSNYIETAFMQQRTDFMKTLPDRRKRFSIPDDVDMYLDIEYVNDQNEAHRLDVFRPSESPDKELPIIFNVHGGGLIKLLHTYHIITFALIFFATARIHFLSELRNFLLIIIRRGVYCFMTNL